MRSALLIVAVLVGSCVRAGFVPWERPAPGLDARQDAPLDARREDVLDLRREARLSDRLELDGTKSVHVGAARCFSFGATVKLATPQVSEAGHGLLALLAVMGSLPGVGMTYNGLPVVVQSQVVQSFGGLSIHFLAAPGAGDGTLDVDLAMPVPGGVLCTANVTGTPGAKTSASSVTPTAQLQIGVGPGCPLFIDLAMVLGSPALTPGAQQTVLGTQAACQPDGIVVGAGYVKNAPAGGSASWTQSPSCPWVMAGLCMNH